MCETARRTVLQKVSLKMDYPSGQLNIDDSPTKFGLTPSLSDRYRRLEMSLLVETVLVTIATVSVIRILTTSSIAGSAWFVAPGILVIAALVPPAIGRRGFVRIGFDIKQVKSTLLVVCWTCVAVFPAMFGGLWLLKFYGLPLPLLPALPRGQSWIYWLFYQFMYVAVAEEVFFRGYLQNNILRLASKLPGRQHSLQSWISIGVSAACFAAAHIIVHGEIMLALTFLPGLILGWLFVRTRSLLAPILFHGLANTFYCVMTVAFA